MFELKLLAEHKKQASAYINKKVVLGVRPEDIYDKLFYTMGPKDGNTFGSTVEVVEPMGSEIYLHLNTGKNTLIAKVDSHNQAKPNQIMELVVNLKKIHLFDVESGKTII